MHQIGQYKYIIGLNKLFALTGVVIARVPLPQTLTGICLEITPRIQDNPTFTVKLSLISAPPPSATVARPGALLNWKSNGLVETQAHQFMRFSYGQMLMFIGQFLRASFSFIYLIVLLLHRQ